MREVIATETEALSREIDQLKAQIGDDIQASLTDIREAIANETEARTKADLNLSAKLGENEAALAQNLTLGVMRVLPGRCTALSWG